jgi:hypothetical protein
MNIGKGSEYFWNQIAGIHNRVGKYVFNQVTQYWTETVAQFVCEIKSQEVTFAAPDIPALKQR